MAVLVAGVAGAADTVCGDLNGSGDLSSSDALFALKRAVGQDVDLRCPAPSVPLRTGQTECYDSSGNKIVCPNTGQDGALLQGAPRSFVDNGDGTISDLATGLMWEKLSDDDSLHDTDRKYSWVTTILLKIGQLNSSSFAGHDDWRLPNRFELDTLVDLGANDPAVHGVFHSNCTPGCTVENCSCTRSESFWTSTSDADPTSYAWIVRFNYGYTDTNPKQNEHHVRGVRGGWRAIDDVPVCGDVNTNGALTSSDALLILKRAVGQPLTLGCPAPSTPPRTGQTACYDTAGSEVSCTGSPQDPGQAFGIPRSFTDNGDGTITDHATGLMWEKQSNDGTTHDVDNRYTWSQALLGRIPTLNSVAFAGHNDWRLPNRFELDTIVSLGAADPATFGAFDSDCTESCAVTDCSCTASDYYWTSTTNDGIPSAAWGVLFETGHTEWSHKSSDLAVRAVRTAGPE